MVTPSQPRGRGRPKRHEVDVLFTRLWFDGVKAKSRLRSAYAIELTLEPDLVRQGPDGLIRPCKWDGYEAGRHVPTGKPGEVSPVDLAEVQYPGTAKFFNSPLRTLLRDSTESMEWILNQLQGLPPKLRRMLFEPKVAQGLAPKLKSFNLGLALQLANAGGFDALVASVLLMRRAELIPSVELRRLAWMAYMATQASVRATPALARVADELFGAIDMMFPNWLYVHHDKRTNVVVHPVSLGAKASEQDLYKLESWDRLMRTCLQRETDFLNLHVDTGKYMKVTELFSFTREELLKDRAAALGSSDSAAPGISSPREGASNLHPVRRPTE
ncbi:hypothetical protein J2X16_004883 [Pelomonas aquatica]|uniref:Uncharacterized protein n=1 Tax=Pelomonas aquatica TaxID=431058 RepID=A0ABU1ZGC4_9BURK|nr:hypothetical protein [Pelomonas aquatica]MDR7299513.1 hypothetical protein [Pelomonas aquatica]